jgi:hypothetical protein
MQVIGHQRQHIKTMRRINPKQIFAVILMFLVSCGTLGHIQFYYYSAPIDVIEKDLIRVVDEESKYSPPLKWNNYELGADSLQDIFIAFSTNPKEIFQLGFANRVTSLEKATNAKLALVGIFDGKIWKFESDLTSNEKERVKKRLETEILSKMRYSYRKEED